MNQTDWVKVRRRLSFLILTTAFATLLPTLAKSQAPGSSRGLASGDGIHTIQGRIHFPSGRAVDAKTVKVKLESVSAFGSLTTVTEQDGSFRFNSLQAGGYTIVVDAGNEYEIARETVNIDREASPGGRIIQVAIQLHYKVDASNPAFANVPATALAFYQKGAAAAKKGNTKEAAELLNKAVASYPNFPIALSELGQQYMLLRDMDKAQSTFEELLKLKPGDPAAHLNLGIALFNKQKLSEAETHLREALKLNSAGPSAHYYLGVTLIGLKRYEEAQREFEMAITNGGDNLAAAHKYLGGLYMSFKKNQQAADELEKYLKLDPKAPDAERIKGTIKDLRSKP
jgi:tetratricopeptide (TPR) repeat protein